MLLWTHKQQGGKALASLYKSVKSLFPNLHVLYEQGSSRLLRMKFEEPDIRYSYMACKAHISIFDHRLGSKVGCFVALTSQLQ